MRATLPSRRASWTLNFQHIDGMDYIVTYSCFGATGIAELFVNTNGKVGSAADVMVSDGATAISIALQFGVPIQVLQHSMKRNADGSAMGALGAALDLAVKDCVDRSRA